MNNWERWVMGWLEMGEGLAKVVTLGYLYPSPSWSFRWAIYRTTNIALRKLGEQVMEQERKLNDPIDEAIDEIIDALDRM